MHDARNEIDQLMAELHRLVSRAQATGRDAVDRALPAAARLQVVTANVDACNPTRRPAAGGEMVALADRHMRLRRDVTERSLYYTADCTMRRLLGEPGG